jgi:L-alanine-DL-glutamate epimerase-like enolase superfamily enzyme
MKITKAAGTCWGEYFSVEVRADEEVTGWGEITTTTKIANRAVTVIIHELKKLLIGKEPSQIERLSLHPDLAARCERSDKCRCGRACHDVNTELLPARGVALGLSSYNDFITRLPAA